MPVVVDHFGILVAHPVHDFHFVRTLPERLTHEVMSERVDRAVLEPDLSGRNRKLLLQGIPDFSHENGQDFAIPEFSPFGTVKHEAVRMAGQPS